MQPGMTTPQQPRPQISQPRPQRDWGSRPSPRFGGDRPMRGGRDVSPRTQPN
jgi:hypothetical protein